MCSRQIKDQQIWVSLNLLLKGNECSYSQISIRDMRKCSAILLQVILLFVKQCSLLKTACIPSFTMLVIIVTSSSGLDTKSVRLYDLVLDLDSNKARQIYSQCNAIHVWKCLIRVLLTTDYIRRRWRTSWPKVNTNCRLPVKILRHVVATLRSSYYSRIFYQWA